MTVPRAKALFIILAIGITVLSLLDGGDPALRILAAAVFISGAILKRGTDDDILFILATGELLVIAVAASSFFAGFFVQCAVIGAALTGGKNPSGRRDAAIFAGFCLVGLVCAILLDRSNNLFLPFLALTVLVVGETLVVTFVAELRERRKYAGGRA